MFEMNLDVRYYETDMQKIVHHSNYLRWFELVRTKMLESWNITIMDIENQGIYYVLKDAYLNYIKPVKYGEIVTLKAKLTKYNGVRLVFDYIVSVKDEIRCTGYTTLVNVSQATMLPVNFKKINKEMNQIMINQLDKN